MAQAEQLEALVRKAADNGFDVADFRVETVDMQGTKTLVVRFADEDGTWASWNVQVNTILFNHDFARALFGEEPPELAYQFHSSIIRTQDNLLESGGWPKWKYHLVRAVISEDPIGYMYDAVFPDDIPINKNSGRGAR